MLLVEFSQQENLNLCSSLLLVAVELGRENLGIIKDERVMFIKVVDDVLESAVLNVARLAVKNH